MLLGSAQHWMFRLRFFFAVSAAASGGGIRNCRRGTRALRRAAEQMKYDF
jgi:hypothetical protein